MLILMETILEEDRKKITPYKRKECNNILMQKIVIVIEQKHFIRYN